MLPGLLIAFATFELAGRISPPARAAISLHASSNPFTASAESNVDGRFRFKRVEPGTYTLSVFVPRRGEVRRTVSVGPSTADRKRRVHVQVQFDEAMLSREAANLVSAKQLSVPAGARREYQEAAKRLSRSDVDGATRHLQRAVEIAPHFAAAWNHLGTIAYQTQRYVDAEKFFRQALDADPGLYEPLVNLGGVLVTTQQVDEAWEVNVAAILRRPNDALAQAQLGMTYLFLSKLELAEKHLLEALRLDPAHFSHPQIHLAEVYLRQKDRNRAAAQLKDFIRRHPDDPSVPKIRETLTSWAN